MKTNKITGITTVLRLTGLIFIIFILTSTSQIAKADWAWQDINDFKSFDYSDLAFNNKGVYVVVGNDGIVKTSTDLTNWAIRESGTKKDLYGCTWGGDSFVVVGTKGTILYSQDGQQWNSIILDEKVCFNDVTWGNGRYWAVGYLMTDTDDDYTRLIYSSSDGINWEKKLEYKGEYDWVSIKFLNNNLLVYGYCGDYAISSNGTQWEFRTIGDNESISDVIWDDSQYVMISNSFIYTSANGLDWRKCSHNLNDAAYLDFIVKLNNKYYLVADYDGTYMLAYSTDLQKWSMVNDETYDSINTFLVNGRTILGVGGKETILSSADGITWNTTSNCAPSLIKVIWNGNEFLAIGDDGSVLHSPDGINWTKLSTDIDNGLADVIWTGTEYLGLAFDYSDMNNSSVIYKSIDGTTWTKYSNINEDNPEKLFFINGIYYLIGYNGEILKSNDAITWTKTDSGTDSYLEGLAWNGKQYVCVGESGTVLTSSDGLTWTKQSSFTDDDLNFVVWNGVKFVTCGEIIACSNNGINWSTATEMTSDDYLWFNDLLWDGNRFIFLNYGGPILTSEDAMKFIQVSEDSLSYPYSLAWNGERYVMVGGSGTISTFLPKDIIKVLVKDVPVVFDVAPRIINNRTMIPARAVLEKLGANMTWNNQNQTIEVRKDNISIILTIGSNVAVVNGKEVALDSPAVIVDNRTLVPLRFLAESLGAEVNWDADTNTVNIL